MNNEWMMDVINDLIEFSDLNNMPNTADALRQSSIISRMEMQAHPQAAFDIISTERNFR